MGHPTGCQCGVRSQHGRCAGGLSSAARSKRPVVCVDETSKQLISETRVPIKVKPGQPARHDYEYERNGTANLFMMFAPLEGWRHVAVTDRHTAVDFAHILKDLSDTHFPAAKRIVLMEDNCARRSPADFAPSVAQKTSPSSARFSTPRNQRSFDEDITSNRDGRRRVVERSAYLGCYAISNNERLLVALGHSEAAGRIAESG